MADHANIMHTFNSNYEYQVSWTIDNFKKTPKVFRGPPFFPIPGLKEKFCFEMNFETKGDFFENISYLYVYLIKLDVSEVSFNLECDLTFRNIDDKILFSMKSIFKKVEKRSLLGTKGMKCANTVFGNRLSISESENSTFSEKWDQNKCELVESDLVVKGTLTFSGYLNSIIRPSFVEQSSSDLNDLSKALKAMYRKDLENDITFRIGGKTLRAHKSILCCRSPVFAKMFDHSMHEKRSNTVNITDVSFQAFDCFILYLYTGKLEDKNWNTVFSLYSVADKYEVRSLQRACSRILGSDLSEDSVCGVLLLSFLHSDEELKNSAKVFIREHFSQISKKSEWVDIVATKPQLASEVLSFVTAHYAK